MLWLWGHVNTDQAGVLCVLCRWSASGAASVSMETNYTVCFLIHIWLQICCSCPIVISPISSVELSICFSFLPPRPSAFIRCRRGPLSVLSLSLCPHHPCFSISHLFRQHICSGWPGFSIGWEGVEGKRIKKKKKKRGWWWRWWWLEFEEGYQFKRHTQKKSFDAEQALRKAASFLSSI